MQEAFKLIMFPPHSYSVGSDTSTVGTWELQPGHPLQPATSSTGPPKRTHLLQQSMCFNITEVSDVNHSRLKERKKHSLSFEYCNCGAIPLNDCTVQSTRVARGRRCKRRKHEEYVSCVQKPTYPLAWYQQTTAHLVSMSVPTGKVLTCRQTTSQYRLYVY